MCCRDLRDKGTLDHAPAFFPGSGLDLVPDSEPVAFIQKGEFKLFKGVYGKAPFASCVVLETPRLQTPPRANMPHADPFETVTAASSSSIIFLSSDTPIVMLYL